MLVASVQSVGSTTGWQTYTNVYGWGGNLIANLQSSIANLQSTLQSSLVAGLMSATDMRIILGLDEEA